MSSDRFPDLRYIGRSCAFRVPSLEEILVIDTMKRPQFGNKTGAPGCGTYRVSAAEM